MSDRADVVVIGGGIMGAAIGYNLAAAGLDTVLLERKEPAAGASGGNLGQISLLDRGEAWHLSLARESLEIYRKLSAQKHIDYQETGGSVVLATSEQEEAAERAIKNLAAGGLEAVILKGKAMQEIEPCFDFTTALGMAYCCREGRLDPLATTLAFVELGIKAGLEVRTFTAVKGFRFAGSKIAKVITSRGEISTRYVLNAAGAWAAEVAGMAGVTIPIRYHRGTAMVSQPVPRAINGPVVGGGFLCPEAGGHGQRRIGLAAVQAGNGSVIIGQATEESSLHDKAVTLAGLSLTAQKFIKHFPALNNLEIIRAWAAVTTYTEDGLPVCGFSSKVTNFFTAAGFKGAFTTAPAIGVRVAETLQGKGRWNIEGFSPDRVS